MSDLSVRSTETLNKHELKSELTNRVFDGQGKKGDLVNRLTKAISEIPREGADISVELVKSSFTDMFLKQEQKILDIIQHWEADTNSQIDWLTQEIKDNNTRSDVLIKETDEIKLSIEVSQDMMEKKIEKGEDKVKSHELQQDKDIDELWYKEK